MSNIIEFSSFLSSVAAKFAQGKDISGYAEDNEKDAAELLKEIGLGFTLLGVGGYRAVFIHKDFPGKVFKVDMYGTSHGPIEQAIFTGASVIEQMYIAPVFHANEHVCVMKRIDGVPLRNAGLTWEEEEAYLFIDRLYPDKYEDAHSENYILCRESGRMILVDYA